MATFPSWTRNDHKRFELALDEVPQDSPYFLENISQLLQKPVQEVKYYLDALVKDIVLIESDKVALPNYYPQDEYLSITEANIPKRKETERKKGPAWTKEEHELFLVGLKKYGKGNWKIISQEFVKTRNTVQIASHAQKYFLRKNSVSKERRRSSIHDITLKDDDDDVTNVPADGSNLESTDQQQDFDDQFLSDLLLDDEAYDASFLS